MQPITKVSMIIIMQPDMQKAVDFYSSFGLKLVFHLTDRWAEFDLNGVKIGLCPTSESGVERRVGAVFEVADLHALYEERKSEGIFINEPAEALHGIMLSMKDPGGNIVDLYQPTPERIRGYAERVSKQGQGCCGGTTCKKGSSGDGDQSGSSCSEQ